MKEHGADVREGSERVRFDSDMMLELVAHAPSEFTIHARNPAHNVRFGGNNLVFSQMASAPNCSDLDSGRRPGNQEDFRNFLQARADAQHPEHAPAAIRSSRPTSTPRSATSNASATWRR